MKTTTPVQICFSGSANLENVKSQLAWLAGNNNYTFHHCFLSRKQVEEKGFDTAIVDLLDEVLEERHVCHLDQYETFDEAMAHIKDKRHEVAELAQKLFVLDSGTADGVRNEIALFTDHKVILFP